MSNTKVLIDVEKIPEICRFCKKLKIEHIGLDKEALYQYCGVHEDDHYEHVELEQECQEEGEFELIDELAKISFVK